MKTVNPSYKLSLFVGIISVLAFSLGACSEPYYGVVAKPKTAEVAKIEKESAASEDAKIQTPAPAPLVEVEPVTPILIVLGGFNSCDGTPQGGNISLKFESHILDFRYDVAKSTHRVPKVVRGCFTDSLSGGATYYFSGLERPAVMDIRVADFFEPVSLESSPLRLIVNGISTAAIVQGRKVKNPMYILAGHSMGGWFAYNVAKELQRRGVKVSALLTIDPISPLHCGPYEYLIRSGAPARGCLEAPSDWSYVDTSTVLEGLNGEWFNFYQTQFFFLHSGPVPVLEDEHKNLEFSYPKDSLFQIEHSLISKDPRVWSFFASRTIRAIKALEISVPASGGTALVSR